MKMAIQATQMYKNDTLTPPSTIHTHTPPHPHPQYTHTHCLFHKEHKQNNRLKLSNIICYAFSSFFHFLFWFLYSFSLFFFSLLFSSILFIFLPLHSYAQFYPSLFFSFSLCPVFEGSYPSIYALTQLQVL